MLLGSSSSSSPESDSLSSVADARVCVRARREACLLVGAPVGEFVGVAVGMSVGIGVGIVVGARVGSGVGKGVGARLGAVVGAGVGTGVGCGVGTGVGCGVGTCVGPGVGLGVGASVGVAVGGGNVTALLRPSSLSMIVEAKAMFACWAHSPFSIATGLSCRMSSTASGMHQQCFLSHGFGSPRKVV